ncbi:G-type lectin S-receptor-like serine/threonine-protein kinase SD3-1 [Macadamia integrifolia]|uniref:G-type lectin S-receptor-like serine/threonine-protein kinase SD3-1 n=1 Tax=Macadamia integrifolia TaxID=60698 RepID=UPI001C4F0B6D|nr:G-type lectin S-receptor-like serine/threonine-protein kinase SD3-1 [Macadamia integrifolia]
MNLSLFLAEMYEVWINRLKARVPAKCFEGTFCKCYSFEGSGSVLAVIVVLGLLSVGFCENFPMVSVPLGFEISEFESKTWVSENGVFTFGFFDDYRKDYDGLAVGIRYNLGNRDANVPVWTVGGGVRVSENSILRLSMDGRLVLLDNLSGLIVWSSNTSGLGVQTASLLNNGNLVLMGNAQEVLWQSFDSPTNTLLPGQELYFPQALRAPSTSFISSYYSLVIRHTGDLALIWENNVTYWGSHLTSSVDVKEARFEPTGVIGLFDATGQSVWSKSSKDFGDPSVFLRHIRIDSDGNLRIYSWDNALHTWKVGWQAVENQCDVFGSCGLYSICQYNSTGPVCECLFHDSLDWGGGPSGMDSGSSGCKKMVDLGNCKMGTSMMVLKQTVLYGLYPPHDIDIMLSEKACKKYCAEDSSCIAVTSKNDGSGLCKIKRTSYISGYGNPSVPATSFLKVCLVPQAASTTKANPQANAAESMQMPSERSISHVDTRKSFIAVLAIIVLVTVCAFLAVEMLVFWFIHQRRQIKAQRRIPFGKDAQMNPHYSALIRLSFEEVKELTTNFTDQLGPTVFKGVLPNKTPVVAKVLNSVVASESDFRMVVSTLGGTHHRNLVPLKGFCIEAQHKIVLYEYIPNGSLDKWLFNTGTDQSRLSLHHRLGIALGVAQAMAYLHSECRQCIPHRNLKLENVLLDEKLVAKVTDFGLQSLLEKGASSSELLPDKDIYMFGEMLLQILTGKRDVLHITGDNLLKLVQEMYQDRNSESGEEHEGVERMFRIALWCLQDQPFLRPSFSEVVKILEGTFSVDRPPPCSAFMKENKMDEADMTEVDDAS